MPRIRDLGISVIPVTMRPPEIGGGAADMYHAQCQPSGRPPQCIPSDAPQCVPTNQPGCIPTHEPCNPTPPQCHPTGTPQCCPSDFQSVCSRKESDAVALPDDAVIQLKQQLQQQIGATLLN
jgi:hypothetical protein